MRFIILTILSLSTLAACMPAGGGGGDYAPAWRGLLSAGVPSPDGAPVCGVPDVSRFDCDVGHVVVRSHYYVACLPDWQAEHPPRSLSEQHAAGDWLRFDHDGRTVIQLGRTQGGVSTRVWCVRDSAPVRLGWLGQVYDASTFDTMEEQCWHPQTGESKPCAALGWVDGRRIR